MPTISPPDKPAFISCTACRLRKVRCSGERPACAHCTKRGDECSYDATVRRRGPDKQQGARIKHRQGRISGLPVGPAGQLRKTMSESEGCSAGCVAWVEVINRPPVPYSAGDAAPYPMYSPPGHAAEARELVWTQLLEDFDPDPAIAVQLIAERCARFVDVSFDDAFGWHSFLSQTVFFHRLYSDDARAPHLVFAFLAHVTFLDEGRGDIGGQTRALQYALDAHRMIAHQLVAGSKCPTLAQAALLLATFEAFPSVWYSMSRSAAAVIYADDCIRACLPLRLDAAHPHVARDLLALPPARAAHFARPDASASASDGGPRVRAWSSNAAWPAAANLTELLKEEMRRTCWTASQVACTKSIWRKLGRKPMLRLAGTDPTKFALLFPGEAAFLERGEHELGKVSVWALCHRAVSLWHLVASHPVSAADRARALEQARMIEADVEEYATQAKLSNYAWQAREWALAVRRHLMTGIDPTRVSHWYDWQLRILSQIAIDQPGVPRAAERPAYGWWYLLQAYSAVEFSQLDPAFAAKAERVLDYSYHALDSIVTAWPCPPLEQLVVNLRHRHLQFRQRLRSAPPRA
ncbi:hypothetical protein Q5752_003429 [Cryptotrichosporon argae]